MDPETNSAVPAQPAPTPTPTPEAVEQTPQQAARADVYQRIYGQTVATPTPPVVETPPEPPTQAVDTPPPTPPPAITPEVLKALQEMTEELKGLKSAAAPAPPPTPTPAPEREDWIELLRAGDFDKAKQVLYSEFAATVGPQLKEQATLESLERYRVEREIDSFLSDLRSKNDDVMPLEDMITTRAQARIIEAQKSGRIKTSQDFVNEYKTSVSAEVEAARKLIQQIRAAGVNSALTSQREVLSSTPVPPSAMETPKSAPAVKAPEVMTPEQYIKARLERNYANRGL